MPIRDGRKVSATELQRTGSRTAKPSKPGLSREGQELALFAAAFLVLVALTERLAFAGFGLFYLTLLIRSITVFLSCWFLNSLHLYYQDFYNRRKHRWERGCSSYGRPPCPGARRAMEDWSTSAPQEPGNRAPLDFDHVQLYLEDFLWCRFFVALPQNLAVFWSLLTLREYRAQ